MSVTIKRSQMSIPIVLLVLILIALQTTSQPNVSVNNTNIPNHCGGSPPTSNFLNNRNSTFDEIRRNLLSQRVLYSRAHESSGGDLVFAAVQCRNYLSVDECVACFDTGVFELVKCIDGDGGFVFLDECFVRYAANYDFYNNPNAIEDGTGTQLLACGNMSASQSLTDYTQSVDEFLSDIRDATPKTSNLYVASTRQLTSRNATIYAISQCADGLNPSICQTCLSKAYTNLKECLPYTEGKFFYMVCFARYSEIPFFNDNDSTDIISILRGSHSGKLATITGTFGGAVLLSLIFVLWILYRQRKRSKKTEQENLEGALNYSYKDLQLATNNFNEENILGKGGFGEVFKAVVDYHNVVAVKKLYREHTRVRKEFENEVKLICNIHHRNLLRLLGWSSEGSNLLLVLEYMENGSLDHFLWGAKKGTLDWSKRNEIILGIAKGLAHLHNEINLKIIHRDIKSSNILLTNDFKPKIADFGLARLHPEDKSHVNTNFVGTMGYAAPEYALYGALSDKVDTYSFGIVILEIVSGQRCTNMNVDRPSARYLIEQAWNLYEKKLHIKLADETLNLNEYEQEQVKKITEIALLCIQSPVSKRPTMSEVVLMLQDEQPLEKRALTSPHFVHNQDRKIHIVS